MDWIHEIGAAWFDSFILLAELSAVFAILARLMPCNPGMFWWRDLRAFLTDCVYWFCLPFVFQFGRTWMLIAGAWLLYAGREPDLFSVRDWPLWQQCLAVLVIQDFLLYWIHRGFHTSAAWKFHAVHHSPHVLDWLSMTRFHPVNSLLEFALVDVLVVLLGFPPLAVVTLSPFNTAYSAMVHANLNWTFGPLQYVVASPVFHRWHHTTQAAGRDKNFAPTFPLFDLVFGTYYLPAGRLPADYGTGDNDVPSGFWGQLWYPFRLSRRVAVDEGASPVAATEPPVASPPESE